VVAGLLVVFAFEAPILERWHLARLRSPDPQVRDAAARYLGRFSSQAAIPKLVQVYTESKEPSPAVVEALWRLGDRGQDALMTALAERFLSHYSLISFPTRDPMPSLMTEFFRSEPLHVETFLEKLDASISEENALLRLLGAMQAAYFLGIDHLAAILKTAEDPDRSSALRCGLLGGIGRLPPDDRLETALPRLYAIAQSRDVSFDFRSCAHHAIDEIDTRSRSTTLRRDGVLLMLTDAEGPAGGAATIELRASFERPILRFLVEIDAGDAITFAHTMTDGTASAGVPISSTMGAHRGPGGGHLVGIDYRDGGGQMPFGSRRGILLARIAVLLRPDAAPGTCPLRLISSEFEGLRERPLKAEAADLGVLRVLPR
jgi:hypothetical protein